MTKQRKIFPDPQGDFFEKSALEEIEEQDQNEERGKNRGKYCEILKQKLPELKKIEGFPIGKDEDILGLSDPPYYTACPNPFIEEFIRKHGKPHDETTDTYHREPFAADVSEGRNDPIYNAHSYHTKVPHKAVMRYILHYTEPGDIVFDGFCGTGMTGVAAQMCGKLDREFKAKIEKEMPGVKWGARYAILCDLSPAATFIAYNYNTPIDVKVFEREAKRILKEVEGECGWMYETIHNDGKTKGKINYTVWSDVFVCPECSRELVFWDVAVNVESGKVEEFFPCPGCSKELSKRDLERAWVTRFDRVTSKAIRQAKRIPVIINYSMGKKRFEKKPDSYDMEIIGRIENSDIPYWYPMDPIPKGDKTVEPLRIGITHVHHFYTKRNLWVLAAIRDKINEIKGNYSLKLSLSFLISSYDFTHSTLMTRIIFKKGGTKPVLTGCQSGTLYISSLPVEKNIFYGLDRMKVNLLTSALGGIKHHGIAITTTQSSEKIASIPSNFVDYIFVDPPFGSNLMYSELNFLWESWLKVFTSNELEAVINKVQRKGLIEYQGIMERCFSEMYRILKPRRWMTVEFHNSKNSVWNTIQEAILRVGFMVADVRTLDKQQGTFNQITPSSSAVKQDLVISAYKPRSGFERRFLKEAGTEEGVWDFVKQHLTQLPISVRKDDALEIVAERQNYLLYDRMVAFHVQRGFSIPISASEFYAGLERRFPERDGMYFLPDQVVDYDRKRLGIGKIEQLSLFMNDEKSAIQWLRQELERGSQTYGEIQPKFLQELRKARHEALPELLEILEQNFLKDENGRWYVPDPNKQSDLEKIREKALLRDFEEYKKAKGRLRMFRTEAIRAGFKKCWAERDYETIVSVGGRLPESVLQEDSSLLMYYDNALMRLPKQENLF